MKRLYLIHESHWEDSAQFAGERAQSQLWRAFTGLGCCWMAISGGYRLVGGDFQSEDREEAWNSHPAVVHLHHPVKEKTLPLSDLLTPPHAYKRFKSEHMELLKASVGATETDTLETLNLKIAKVHPGCTVYPVPKTNPRWIY
jgi:hypothetical protein